MSASESSSQQVHLRTSEPRDPAPFLFDCWKNNLMTDCTLVADRGDHRVNAHQVRIYIPD